ncbi:MAG: hypothetical protein WEA04_04960 [Candidatus Andersenbacteria bacterium]
MFSKDDLTNAPEDELCGAITIVLEDFKKSSQYHLMINQSHESDWTLGARFEEHLAALHIKEAYRVLCVLVAEYRRRGLSLPDNVNADLKRNVALKETDIDVAYRCLV